VDKTMLTITEWILEYLRGAAELFRGHAGFDMHPALLVVQGRPTIGN